jgi:L-alanine-DL-glutamate epimerase-like enolase superfamily enzyme
MMGLPSGDPVYTSYTIGIDSEEKLEQKIREAEDFVILKIKAGTADDKALVNMVRKYTSKPLCVDVNQGWTDKKLALEMLEWLKDQQVLFVEQPMPKEMVDEMTWLTENSPIPTIADESVKRLSDLEKIDGAFSGINIKLMKSTGLREAMRMINYCKKNGLLIMLGCMAESSCATTAMAQLMHLADFIDLDAPLLYSNDPFKGITYENGKIFLNTLPGIGVEPQKGFFP